MTEFGMYDGTTRPAADVAAAAEALRAATDPLGIEVPADPGDDNGDSYGDLGPTGIGVSEEEGWELGGKCDDTRTAEAVGAMASDETVGPTDGDDRHPHRPRPILSLFDPEPAPRATAAETQADEPSAAATGGTGTSPVLPPPDAGAELPEPDDGKNGSGDGQTPAGDTPGTPADGANTEAAGETGSETARPQDVVGFRFVRADHVPEMAETIAEKLDGCKTAVFEFAGGAQVERELFESTATAALSADPRASDFAKEILRTFNLAPAYVLAVLDHMPASVERVRVMDVNQEHPLFEDLQITERAFEHLLDGLLSQQSYTLHERLIDYLGSASASVPRRNENMAGQLDTIAADVAPDGPQTVGVVTGLGHEGTGRLMTSREYQCSDTIATTISPVDEKPIVSPYAKLLIGAINDPSTISSEYGNRTLFNKTLLELTYGKLGYAKDFTDIVLTLTSDERVAQLTLMLDTIKFATRDDPPEVQASAVRSVLQIHNEGILEVLSQYLRLN